MTGWGNLWSRRRAYLLGGVSLLATATFVAEAQETTGLKLSVDVSQGLTASDNLDFTTTPTSGVRSVTGLGFGLSSQTRTQVLNFNLGGNFELGTNVNSLRTLQDPTLGFNYSRDGQNARFDTQISYREADVSSLFEDDPTAVNTFLILSEGQRRSLFGSVGLTLGKNAPVGTTARLTHSDISYRGTTDPNLFDSETNSATLDLRFDIDPRITAHLISNYSDRTTTGIGVNREAWSVGTSVDFAVAPDMTASARLSYDHIDLLGGPASSPTDRTETGVSWGFGLSQEVANGEWNGNFDSEVGENGRRTSASIQRVMVLPRGALALSFGVSRTEGLGGIDPLFGVDYVQELSQGTLTVNLTQSVDARADNQEVLNTDLEVLYEQELNSLSSLEAGLSLRDNNLLGGAGDASRIDLSLTYRHDLAQDWDVVGTYTHSVSSAVGRADISSNTIFVGLEKRFSWTP